MVHVSNKAALHALLAKENCAFYASEFLRGPPKPPYNGRFITGRHHESWADLITQYKRLCVIAPRGHGKSHFFTHAYPLWSAERNPGQSGFLFSASQPQAEEILIRIMREVETNPRLKHLLPAHAKTGPVKSNKRWSQKTLEFSNGFTLQARGYGTKVRGAHPVFIAADDILNDETAFSETVRMKQNDYFFNAVTPMIMPGGQIVVVGTPMHSQDLYGELKKNKEYVVRDFPAIDNGGNALWPEVFSINELHRIRDEIKALRFSREYLCQPITDLSSLFPLTLFRGEPTEQFNVRIGLPADHWQWRSIGITEVFIGVDFAISANAGGDYTVVFVVGVDRYGNRWIMDILREKGMDFTVQKGLINTAARTYRAGLIFAEANQMQRIFADELMRETDLPIKPFVTTGAKHSLDNGLPAMRVLLENSKWRIPRGCPRSIELTDLWISEMQSFTVTNGKILSTGEHDDVAMASYICDQAIRQGSFGFSFEEEPEDAQALVEEIALAEEEAKDPWNDGIPGGGPIMGGQPIINAGLVNTDAVDEDLDNPRNLHGDPKTRIVGYVRPGTEPPKDWRPKLGAPTAADILNAIGYGRG